MSANTTVFERHPATSAAVERALADTVARPFWIDDLGADVARYPALAADADADPGFTFDGAQRRPESGVPAADDHEIGVRVSPKRRVCGPTPPDVVGPERRGHGACECVLDRGG